MAALLRAAIFETKITLFDNKLCVLDNLLSKKHNKICRFQIYSYLCNPFRWKTYWRVGRVVECGGLENR